MNRRILLPVSALLIAGALYSAYRLGRADGLSRSSVSPQDAASQKESEAPQDEPQQKWKEHTTPAGLSVLLPGGWQTKHDPATGMAVLSSTAGEALVIWPLFVPGRLSDGAARLLLERLLVRLHPRAQWREVRGGEDSLSVSGDEGERALAAVCAWTNSAIGTAAHLYVAAAPRRTFNAVRYARIFESARIKGSPAPAEEDAPRVRFVKWTDPRENAFTLEVPAGWRVEGGLFRFASVDTRAGVNAASPDGKMIVMVGDPQIPRFVVPNQILLQSGFPEGSWYSPGYGVQNIVQRYLTGSQFAHWYLMNNTSKQCPGLRITDQRERPDVVEKLGALYRQAGNSFVQFHMTAGEARFTCSQNGQPRQGHLVASTVLSQAGPVGNWGIEHLVGYMAAPEQAALAEQVVKRMVETYQPNPQWWAMQQHLTGTTSRIVSQTHNEISKMLQSSYEQRSRTMDEIFRRDANARRGVEDVVDPVTGTEMKVESGSNYYWIDNRGTIVGTDVETKPSLDFRELIRLP